MFSQNLKEILQLQEYTDMFTHGTSLFSFSRHSISRRASITKVFLKLQ